ncbi:hypothetical protein WJX79_003291 [Trebouxia sp. C0005]
MRIDKSMRLQKTQLFSITWRDLEDIDLETYNNHLEIITLVPRRFAESTANVGDLITHIYASGLAWIETAVVWLLQGNTTMPTGDKALEVVKVRKFWDETLKHTSIYVTPRNTDVMDDAADSDDKGRGRGLKTDDFGADQDANRSNTIASFSLMIKSPQANGTA